MSDKAFHSWEKILNPAKLKSNLVLSSVFLTAYETLKNSIIDQPKSLYKIGFDGERDIIDPKYETEVIQLYKGKRNPFRASCIWWKNNNVLTNDIIDIIIKITDHRNLIAHETLKFLGDTSYEVNTDLLYCIIGIISKVDIWWIREFEIPCNAEFDDQDTEKIPDTEIRSGNMMLMSLIAKIINGNEDYLKNLHKDFVEQYKKMKNSNQ